MRARRVKTVNLLGHVIQVGFQIKATGPGRDPSKRRWKIAGFVEDHAPVQQCWSDLVSWVFRYGGLDQPIRDRRPVDYLPWRPIGQSCRDSATENGSCYCGKVGRADIAAMENGPNSSVIVPDPCAGGCTCDHDHAAGGWKPLCSNCSGCWPTNDASTSSDLASSTGTKGDS